MKIDLQKVSRYGWGSSFVDNEITGAMRKLF
jgi:hypothetical protein